MDADLVVIGHHHEPRGLREHDGQLYLIPGATEAVDLGEKGPFGVYILEIGGGQLLSHDFLELKPLHLISSRRIVAHEPRPLNWFRERVMGEVESFLRLLRDRGVEGILRVRVSGVVVGGDPFPELRLDEEIRRIREKNQALLHMELEEELVPILRDEEGSGSVELSREELLKNVFSELGRGEVSALELAEEVALVLEEKASERTGLLRESDRARFAERWSRLLLESRE